MQYKVLGCPFCGYAPHIKYIKNDNLSVSLKISCENESCGVIAETAMPAEGALRGWNKRAVAAYAYGTVEAKKD